MRRRGYIACGGACFRGAGPVTMAQTVARRRTVAQLTAAGSVCRRTSRGRHSAPRAPQESGATIPGTRRRPGQTDTRARGSTDHRPPTQHPPPTIGYQSQPFEGERMSVLSCRFPRSYQLCREATLMLLNDVFERFVQDSPVSVMVRGLLENTLSPRFLDELFANAAELQYTRTLLFSSVVDLMGLVVNRIQPAVNSAYHARAKTIGVSLK